MWFSELHNSIHKIGELNEATKQILIPGFYLNTILAIVIGSPRLTVVDFFFFPRMHTIQITVAIIKKITTFPDT